MKVGDLVYATLQGDHEPDHVGALGLIAKVEPRQGGEFMGDKVYRIFWLDGEEPSWYYEHEVESISEVR
tara:strand:+ start:414 stop:620 length:207 start_codon:yes stop_codon:yes gene_type:complete